MLTKDEAVALHLNDTLVHATKKDSRKQPMKVRVSGKTKTWKTRPDDFKVPVKYGLYQSGYIEPHNAAEWSKA